VHVVFDRVRYNRRRLMVGQDAHDVGIQVWADFIMDPRFPALGAENQMDKNVGKRLRRTVPPARELTGRRSRGLSGLRRELGNRVPGHRYRARPLRSPWAVESRPFGPG
jgi:hypothetical protein